MIENVLMEYLAKRELYATYGHFWLYRPWKGDITRYMDFLAGMGVARLCGLNLWRRR